MKSIISSYGVAAALAAAAVVLLVVGSPAKAAVAGAGFAILGAALTRGVDIARERRTAAAKAAEDRRRDLDETRRLAYAMLAKGGKGKDPMLLGTVLNALAHHGLGVNVEEAAEHLSLVDDGAPPHHESNLWLQAQVARIGAELGDATGTLEALRRAQEAADSANS